MNERLPVISGTRIPYHPIVQERYGIAAENWRALTEAVFPSAQTIEGVMLALSYCKSRNLDVFKRPVHIVPIWNKDQNRYVETVWPGIGELRTTAFRTGDYAGTEPVSFGPDMTMKFDGQAGRGQNSRQVHATVTFPEWAQVTVYRMVRGEIRHWPGPRVYWLETYARIGQSDVPNEMWQKRPRGQLEKCAEAAALRKAFPEEIGEQYIGDEIGEGMKDVTPAQASRPSRPTDNQDPMDDVVAQARGNGEATRSAAEAPTAPLPFMRPKTPPESAAPAHEPPAQTAEPSKRRPGRPTKAETQARLVQEIVAEINATAPEHVEDYLIERQDEINQLPREMQDTIDQAADERRASVAADPEPVRYHPETGEIEPEPGDGSTDADDDYQTWLADMRAVMAKERPEFLRAKRNQFLAEARENWSAQAVDAVEAAFQERTAGGGA